MAHLMIRKMAKELGVLEPLANLKRKFIYQENAFKPADPRLLISMNRCLEWLRERNLLQGSDYMEFGIFRGFNLWYVQNEMRSLKVEDVRYFGFDSFFGLPEVRGVDAGGSFAEGQFYASRFEVEKFLTKWGVDWNATFLIEGWFNQTLNQDCVNTHKFRRCSLCVVDCDLYESTVDVLRFVEPFLADNSIIWFDDWNDFGDTEEKGERKAFSEFLKCHPSIEAQRFEVANGSGLGFIIQRNKSC